MYKVRFIDVGPERVSFAVTMNDSPNDRMITSAAQMRFPAADVKCHDGQVLFGNGNPGCYVRYGSYTVQEVEA